MHQRPSINDGQIDIQGVTTSGFQLVSWDSNTPSILQDDAFNNKLSVNGIVCHYCKRGFAPTKELLASVITPGTYYIGWNSTDYFYVKDSNGNSKIASADKYIRIFTLVIQGAGGGGGASVSGDYAPPSGGGGGAGGTAVITFKIEDKLFNENESFEIKVVVGNHGQGGNSNDDFYSNGTSGEATLCYIRYKNSNENLIIKAFGGGGGHGGHYSSVGSGAGGTAEIYFENIDQTYLKVLAYKCGTGGSGGKAGNNGDSIQSITDYPHVTVNSSKFTFGDKSGGKGNRGGGGGASWIQTGGAGSTGPDYPGLGDMGSGGGGGGFQYFASYNRMDGADGGAGALFIYY